jgi:hypothetical protein
VTYVDDRLELRFQPGLNVLTGAKLVRSKKNLSCWIRLVLCWDGGGVLNLYAKAQIKGSHCQFDLPELPQRVGRPQRRQDLVI